MLEHVKKKLAAGETVRVIAYGDSISTSCTPDNPDYHGGASGRAAWYGQVLERLLNDGRARGRFVVESFGVGGQNSYEGLGRLWYMGPLKPDLVLVAFGANDAGWHHLPPECTHDALVRIVDGVRDMFKCDVMIMGMGGDGPVDARMIHMDETVDAARRTAAEKGVPFVDIRATMLDVTEGGKRWAEFHLGPGDCHPNDKGHAVWARTVHAAIAPMLA